MLWILCILFSVSCLQASEIAETKKIPKTNNVKLLNWGQVNPSIPWWNRYDWDSSDIPDNALKEVAWDAVFGPGNYQKTLLKTRIRHLQNLPS